MTYDLLLRGAILYLRITSERKVVYLSLRVNATPEDFRDAQKLRCKPQNMRLAQFILWVRATMSRIQMDLIQDGQLYVGANEIKAMANEALFGIVAKPCGSFLTVFEEYMHTRSTPGTKGLYAQTISKMKAYDKNLQRRTFDDIDLKWLSGFEAFCAQTACKNARNIHLRNIRAVFNHALDYEFTRAYPFRRFKIKAEPTRKRSLSVQRLRELFDWPVDGYARIYRDMFKLIFMLIGINSVDLYGLTQITTEGRIEYKRAKTHRLYSVLVEPEALELIKLYRGKSSLLCLADRWGDYRNFLHQTNKALQNIGCERKGLGGKKQNGSFPGLTTYWARHTWATIAASLDIPKDTIAAALGHGETTVTDIYIDFDQSKVDAANRKVLDWVLYNKK